MKAIQFDRYGSADVLHLTTLPDPVPAPGEVLISVRCASVIPGDWKVRSGSLQSYFPIDLPTVPGRDGAGVVIATGEQTDWAEIGDELCFVTEHVETGSYAELIARARPMTIPKPANVDFAHAAAMMHAGACAWIALVDTARIQSGQQILIHAGAGAIGGMAVQIAKHLGCRVSATCSAANIEYVRSLGAERVIAYDRPDTATDLPPQDVVLDLVGGPVHEASCRALRKSGVLVWLIAEPFEDVSATYGVDCRQAMIHDRRETLEHVAGLVADGVVKPQVSHRLPLSEAADAHRLLERGENSRGRIILEMEEQPHAQ